MRSALLILCLVCASEPTFAVPRSRQETFVGRVVAYSGALVCMNGNSYWSMIIRIQRPKDNNSEFLRVDLSLPCGRSAEWVSTKPAIQKFRLFRQKACDKALGEFMDSEPKQGSAILMWKHPPGAEHDALPFGQVVPCYRSVDLPLAPIV
jgi:hypothetical protein